MAPSRIDSPTSFSPPRQRRRSEFTRVVSARLPAAIADSWVAQAAGAGLSVSDWLRQAVDLGKVKVTGIRPGKRPLKNLKYTQADPRLVFQLAQLGNNINQITHQLNYSRAVGQEPDIHAALLQIVAIRASIEQIVPAPKLSPK